MDTKFNVVLVADRLYTDEINTEFDASDLEKISDQYYYGLYEELKKVCGGTVFHYQSPKDLADNAYKHKDDIVFTIYGGEKSRNRMALVPAVCESYGLKYVGADTYARIICQDKYLSKIYCERFGLRTAPSFLLEVEQDIQLMKDLSFPLVLKPNMEGSSIGITDDSIVYNMEQASSLARRLFKVHNQPVLAEEFIEGKEISFYIIGQGGHFSLLSALEIYMEGDEDFLCKHLYSAEVKHHSDDIVHRDITYMISPEDIEIVKQIFISLGKMDFMRVDCRLRDNVLYLIELTPDAYIGPYSGFIDAARTIGKNYTDVIDMIIHTAYSSNQSQYASLK